MREKRSGGGVRVTCDDCYFRQELLCALEVEVVCPTFRATVGRKRRPAAPKQAPLVPMPVMHTRTEEVVVARAPFGAHEPESNFSVRDVAPTEQPVPARELVQVVASEVASAAARYAAPQPPARAAAAGRSPEVASVTVPVAAEGEPEQVALPLASHDTARFGRVSRRIAERYPHLASRR